MAKCRVLVTKEFIKEALRLPYEITVIHIQEHDEHTVELFLEGFSIPKVVNSTEEFPHLQAIVHKEQLTYEFKEIK